MEIIPIAVPITHPLDSPLTGGTLSLKGSPPQPPVFTSPADLFNPADNGVWWQFYLSPEQEAFTGTDAEFLVAFPDAWLFQDIAGTVPVRAQQESVGKCLDKSGKGHHWSAASDPARPIYSAFGSGGTATKFIAAQSSAGASANINFSTASKLSVCMAFAAEASGSSANWNILNLGGSISGDTPGGFWIELTTLVPRAFAQGSTVTSNFNGVAFQPNIVTLDAYTISCSWDLAGTDIDTFMPVKTIEPLPGLQAIESGSGFPTQPAFFGNLPLVTAVGNDAPWGGEMSDVFVIDRLLTPTEWVNLQNYINSHTTTP